MIDLQFVPRDEFARVLSLDVEPPRKAALFADLCRINTLYMIARAGSGHKGSWALGTNVLSSSALASRVRLMRSAISLSSGSRMTAG